MTGKKFLSVILSVLFVLVSAIPVFAEDATAKIKVTPNVFEVVVEVTTTADGVMTAQIVNEANNKLAGMQQTSVYTKEEDGNVYKFNFKMHITDKTGPYVVRVGNNVKGTEKPFLEEPFEFVDAYDVVAFFNKLDVEAAVKEGDQGETVYGIYNLLTGKDSKLNYDLTAYKALSEDTRLLVDAVIEALPLATTIEKVEATEKTFKDTMDKAISMAVIIDGKTEQKAWETAVEAAIKAKQLDGTYYKGVPAELVKKYFANEKLVSLDESKVNQNFAKAQILAAWEKLDYLSLKEVFMYFQEKKDVADIDDDNYDAVLEAELENDLFEDLKNVDEREITSFADLEDKIDSIMKDLLDDPGSGDGPGSGIGSRPSTDSIGSGDKGSSIVNGDSANRQEETVYNTDFSDIGEAAWAQTAIEGLAAKGIVSGRGDGKFYPNDVMTREEFVKLIVVAFDAYDKNATASFRDVATDRWSYPYIASANRLGFVTGIDASTFSPTGTITREDMAVIIYRVYELAEGKLSGNVSFNDSAKISAYAKTAVGALASKGVINGMGDGTFAPKSAVTRAQAAKVVYELLALIG